MIEMAQKIKGVKATGFERFMEFEYERNKALLSLDEKKIRKMYAKWDIVFPPEGEGFWEAVAKNILRMTDAPTGARIEAVRILDELNMEFDDGKGNGNE